ncbi:hypothetical protein AURDEDRAFT_129015 [Auricularia subglabra TFB-10046 SS5]|nr:hypothetical protein AURDEDRAFT_129015 [Auricularia subglabra TFB-10046 SS5]
MSANAANPNSNAFAPLHVEQYGSDDGHDAQAKATDDIEDVEMDEVDQPDAQPTAADGHTVSRSTQKASSGNHDGAKKSKARLVSDIAIDTSPKKATKNNDGVRVPVEDPVEDDETTSEVAVKIAVANAIQYFDDSVRDGHKGSYCAHFPPKEGGREAHHQYYKGFCVGAHSALKGKKRAREPSPELWGVDLGDDENARDDAGTGPKFSVDGFRGADNDHSCDRRSSAEEGGTLVHAILPPAAQPPKRVARHLNPSPGPIEVHALRNIDRPEGTDRRSVTCKWHPRQRNALFDYKKPGAFVQSEQAGSTPASPEATVAIIKGIWNTVYKGQPPPSIILPIPANPGEAPPPGAFVSGTFEQIEHFTDACTWSTSIGCIQAFPNEDLDSDFACTYRAPGVECEQASTLVDVIVDALDKSDVVKDYVVELGGDLDTIKDGVYVEYICIKEGWFDVNMFNAYVPPPSRVKKHALRWREIMADLTPTNDLVSEIVAHKRPFKCATCGCLRHPQGMCSTISEPKWLGFLPTPHNPPEPPKPATPAGSKVAVAGGNPAGDAPKASSSGTKKNDKAANVQPAQKNKKGGKSSGKN